jgi:ABC-type uncharacterized transport system substrate-binding protein
LLASSSALPAQIEVVLSDEAGAYAEAAAELRNVLTPAVSTSQRIADSGERASDEPEILVTVALGTRALKAALAGRGARVISALVPRESFQAALLAAPKSRDLRSVTAIYLDQPHARQLNLIRAVVPGQSRIGVLHSMEGDENLKGLRAAARSQGLEVADEWIPSQKELFPALSRMLAAADVIQAIPDPTIFNSGNIPNILLAAFRDGRPLFGFSPAYVRAGALAAVYSTPGQVAREVADVARRILAGGAPPPPRYPQLFTVGVNATVARSLHLAIPEGTEIEAKLQAMEREQ